MTRPHPATLIVAALLGCLSLGAGSRAVSVEPTRWEKIVHKLGRGFANVFMSVVEIPREAYFVTQEEGAGIGLSWGIIRGAGVGCVRLLAGGYDLVTFPLSVPYDYQPILQPEFATDAERTDLSSFGQ
ncbi:MAG: exosortase system-associated protein, TIGR04073 family [Candidatus Omnitrophica bacterium]|nr:exosortase system-associated protein, TIGR04073 family [Candidatus Omnitrophota bacterium]